MQCVLSFFKLISDNIKACMFLLPSSANMSCFFDQELVNSNKVRKYRYYNAQQIMALKSKQNYIHNV